MPPQAVHFRRYFPLHFLLLITALFMMIQPHGAAAESSDPPLPVSANPVKWTQSTTLVNPDGAAGDWSGNTVAIDGDIAVVGSFHDTVNSQFNQGSAQVFGRNQDGDNSWGLIATLTLADGAADDQFGQSVAVDGDTIVVGAYLDDRSSNFDQGSAYVFGRNQGGTNNWGLVATLTAPDGESDDWFGYAVAISGDTILVGAPDDTVAANLDQGSVYVFQRNEGGSNSWGHLTTLTDSSGSANDLFGTSVAIDQDVAVVGAEGDNNSRGSAHVFGRNQGGNNSWGTLATLTDPSGSANDLFGTSVAIDANTIVIGASRDTVDGKYGQGSAHIFGRNEGGSNSWGHVASRTDPNGAANERFGSAVAIDNDTIIVGASRDTIDGQFAQGSASIFGRNYSGNNTWGYVATITNDAGASGDYFGTSLAISDDTLLVGAYGVNIDSNFDQGNATVFNRSGGDWLLLLQVDDPDATANDQFGSAIALDGEILAIGAPQADVDGSGDQGTVYIFSRNQDGDNAWGLLATVTAPDGASGDLFGSAITLDGDTLAVGAPLDDVGNNSDQGSVHLFDRNQGGENSWGHVTMVEAPDGASFDEFGSALALDADTLIVGAHLDNVGSNPDQGSAHLFDRNQGGENSWGHVKTLRAPSGAAFDQFGRSVAIAGNEVVVGAFWDTVGGNFAQGSAHVFGRNEGGTDNWGHLSMLTATNGQSGDRFGRAVAISEGTIAVGAYADSVDDNVNQGSVHIFSASASRAWSSVKMLTDANGGESHFFGASLTLDGSVLLVGAARDNVVRSAAASNGSAHIYGRNVGGGNNWGLITSFEDVYSDEDTQFGAAVSLDGDTLAIGTNQGDAGAHLFGLRDKPSLGIYDVSVDEGVGLATVTVLQSNVGQNTTVHYSTTNGSAKHGSDYTRKSGIVTIPAGQVETTFTVPITDDPIDENDEQFTVSLATPVNATIAITTATVTIEDNDAQPTITISDTVLDEKNSSESIVVTLSHQSALPITVSYHTSDQRAKSGQDYASTAGTITFAPLTTIRAINVTIFGDVLYEPGGEQFMLKLTNPQNATLAVNEATITIQDNDFGVFIPIAVSR